MVFGGRELGISRRQQSLSLLSGDFRKLAANYLTMRGWGG